MSLDLFHDALAAFCFGYPFVMAFYWVAGGLLFHLTRERHEPRYDQPPRLAAYPPVSILVPCYNEAVLLRETLAALTRLDYPEFEIIAINDGSQDDTAAILDALTVSLPQLRVVHLAHNQGKSTALNTGALLARHELLVCIDGDALLDPHAVTWLVRRFQTDAGLGGLTGNPRIRNRATLLGRLQVGEFSTVAGLIKRTQTVVGFLFTVSGVVCAFRKQALFEVGGWARHTLTDDVDVSWRLQLAGWRLAYEPKALAWILMPETLLGLWRQRLRWSEGGTQVILESLPHLFAWSRLRMWPMWLNYAVSIVWSYAMLLGLSLWTLGKLGVGQSSGLTTFSPIPQWWGTVLALTYLAQSLVSVGLDSRFERGLLKSFFWMVWYPLAFWLLQAGTAVVGLPKALLRPRHWHGKWVSPDRGIR